jgi:ADP-ribose pyrophosphatase YjhB (NUDIX family)
MSEILHQPTERKLWYEGPNYAADAVIFDPEIEKILLIKRSDTGEWALPGGFIDASDASPLEAAMREAKEEAGASSLSAGALVYRGTTSDRRSSADSWVETSAYLFRMPAAADITAGDDATCAAWHRLHDLPSLYGAHHMIAMRALDYLASEQLLDIVQSSSERLPVSGGYMQYTKYIAKKDNQLVFVKEQPETGIVSPERRIQMLQYLEKEAGIMAHLRVEGFEHIPDRSIFRDGRLAMDALRTEDGWKWEADSTTLDRYIEDSLAALNRLESTPTPTDKFTIEPTYESLLREGWQSFNETSTATLETLVCHVPAAKQKNAHALLADIPYLRRGAASFEQPQEFVFCHYDMRQENLAWHPEKGVKIIDWSWAGMGLPGSDATSLLIDLHKNGHDVTNYLGHLSRQYCLTLMGFWLTHSTLPNQGAEGLRSQQFISALSAYELLLASGA